MIMDYEKKAEEVFSQKYHCSQAVLAAFAEELGITEKQALKLGACFGGGMCKGEVCGACTGALMALGLKYGQSEVDDLQSRLKTNEITVRFLETFGEENGSYICRELLGCDLSTEEGIKYARENNLFTEFCPKMVISATKIAKELMNEE
jgi:C_GCAxxG_C_C family probable redox protein